MDISCDELLSRIKNDEKIDKFYMSAIKNKDIHSDDMFDLCCAKIQEDITHAANAKQPWVETPVCKNASVVKKIRNELKRLGFYSDQGDRDDYVLIYIVWNTMK